MGRPKTRTLTVFTLAMINIAAICNIANLPFTAKYGLAALFYYALAAIIFFIPVGLVSAELATGWPDRGVYIWVREALGEKLGFVAIWLQWIENVIWYPTILSYCASTFAYIINPSLAFNKVYIAIAILVIFWTMTLVNLLGMKVSGFISSFCGLLGIILPGALIFILGAYWLMSGHESQTPLTWSALIPKFNSFSDLSVLTAVLLSLGGLEMSAVHAKEVENPQRNFPKAIFLSALLILVILSLGALSIAVVVPNNQIQLASGTIEAFQAFFTDFNIAWALPLVALSMTIGALGSTSTWLVGPIKGLLATAKHGELPPVLQKVNKHGMPYSIMIVQGLIVSLLSLVFLFMPSITSSYHMIFYLTAQLYLIMYVLMFISVLVLRYKRPEVKRTFKVPFIWVISTLGALSAAFAIIMGFIPPEGFDASSLFFFEGFLILGIVIFCVIPLIIHSVRKPSWKTD